MSSDGIPDEAHDLSGRAIQQHVGVLLVKMFWTSKTSYLSGVALAKTDAACIRPKILLNKNEIESNITFIQ